KPVAFGKAGAEKPINQWVARATQDRIKSIIDGTKDTDRMYLINAIYFNGTWQEPFYEESTRPQRFTRADGTTKEHPFMNQGGRYRYLRGENFQAAALPYGDGRMNLYVFVPDQGVTLGKFYESLTPENWDSWMSRFGLKQGSVAIPKLKLDYEKKLNDALKNLGMGVAFTGEADFGGLFANNPQLFISYVKQKTYLDMNEKGTEAAAVTVVAVKTGAPAPQERFTLVADRPYFIAIRDDRTGAVLFVGSIVDPQ
ncbi:MAG TPA: serpin family protein, partial [Symbiobacteriaceae bacterium]|nr:serpin family protein [Symbiobacteriaceae bacterium]